MTCDLLALFAQQQEVDLTAVCRALAECANAAGAIVFASDGELLTVAAAVPGDRRAQAALSLPVGFGVTGLVARNGQPVLLEDDSPRNPAYRQLLTLGPTGHVARMCLPARGGDGSTSGVVALHREPGRPFSRRRRRHGCSRGSTCSACGCRTDSCWPRSTTTAATGTG